MGDRAGETQPSCSWNQFRATGIQKSSSTLLLVAKNPDFLSLISALHVTTRYRQQWTGEGCPSDLVDIHSPSTQSVLILHLQASFQLQSYREKTNSAHTLTNSLIPIPPLSTSTLFCQRRCFDQDCPGLRQVKMKLISFCSFRPDEDQGNPGRNVVSDKKVCWC